MYLARGRVYTRLTEVKCSYKPSRSLCEVCVEYMCITAFVWNKINILVVFSNIPVFCLDYKLPTTLKHRTRNIRGLSGRVEFKELFVC